MGYYSEYTVETSSDLEDLGQILADYSGGYHFDHWGGAWHTDSVKWYDYREDIANLSHAYPDVEFTITRESEDGAGYRFTVKDGLETKTYKRGWVLDD